MIKCKLQQQRALSALSAVASATTSTPRLTTPLATVSTSRAYAASAAPLVTAQNVRETFKNPVDVVRQTVAIQGPLGMWRGFGATLAFRTSFAVGNCCRRVLASAR
jgi:hypothetical protein